MGTSRTACSIDMHESAIIRLEESGRRGVTVTGCCHLPFGLEDITSSKGKRLMKKLSGQLRKFRSESLALCIAPETYLSLTTCFAPASTDEEFRSCCQMEAAHFLRSPLDYQCDIASSDEKARHSIHEKKLLLFYPCEPAKRLSDHLSAEQRIQFSCSPQLSLLHLSEHSDALQVILEMERNYILLAAARNGRLEKFDCRQVRSRDEALYFTIRELTGNTLVKDTEIQVSGAMADKAMMAVIEKETRVKTRPLGIPASLNLVNPDRFTLSSPPAVKAIGTALMALSGNGTTTFRLQ